jgi:hypothetical protein
VSYKVPVGVLVNGALIALAALAIVGVQAADRPAASVESSVRRYAQAMSNGELDAAMAEIAPDQRAKWREWVGEQLGNVYEVRGIAVRAPSLLAPPSEVTVDLDVNREFPEEFYQPTPRVPVEAYDGRWYLAAPLLSTY